MRRSADYSVFLWGVAAISACTTNLSSPPRGEPSSSASAAPSDAVSHPFVDNAPALKPASSRPSALEPPTSRPAGGERPHSSFQAIVDRAVQQAVFVGGSAAVGYCGRVAWSGAAGWASVSPRRKMTAGTASRIGSVSKVLTAVAFMRMVERKALGLDQPVGDVLPGLPDAIRPIVPRQILNHTSGIRHYEGEEFLSTRQYARAADGLQIFVKDNLLFEPGHDYSYSTYAFTLLSAVMARAANVAFPALVRAEVLTPAAMEQTWAEDSTEVSRAPVVQFHQVEAGAPTTVPVVNNSYKWAGGGYLSTSPDLVRFGNAVLDGRLVAASTWARMRKGRDSAEADQRSRFGIGWALDLLERIETASPDGYDAAFFARLRRALAGRAVVGHGGGSAGARAYLFIVPDARVVVAALSNAEQGPVFALDLLLATLEMRPDCGTTAPAEPGEVPSPR